MLSVNEKEINILVKAFEMYEKHVITALNCNINKEKDPTQAEQAEASIKFWRGREFSYLAKVKSMHNVFKAMSEAELDSDTISEATECKGKYDEV